MNIRNQKGFVLITVVLLSSVLFAGALTYMDLVIVEHRTLRASQNMLMAQAVSEAGVEDVAWEYNYNAGTFSSANGWATNGTTRTKNGTVTNGASGVTAIIDNGTITTRPLRFYRAGLATRLARFSESISANNLAAGGLVAVSGTITNGSCSGISVNAGAFHVGVYGLATAVSGLTTMAPFYEKSVSGCPADGSVDFSVDITINPQTPPGTYYLGYSINDENEVPDCDLESLGTIWYWTLTVH